MTTLYTAESARDLGYQFTLGAMSAVGGLFVAFVIIGAIISALYNPSRIGRDDTDRPTGERSNLKVRTDHLTGCQYLENSQGALTPRLDAQGRPLCTTKGRP